VLVREPRLLAFRPTIRSLDATRVAQMRVAVMLPERWGNIEWGYPTHRVEPGKVRWNRRYAALLYLPQIESVADRIRQTLMLGR
jgi:hypothetical protein